MPFPVQNHGNHSLSFKPQRPIPQMVAFYWNDVLLNPERLQNAKKVDLSDQPLGELLFDLFGKLNLMEIFFLHQGVEAQEKLQAQVSWPQYFQKQNRFFNEKVSNLFKALNLTSPSFLKWCDEKKMENKDLYPLLSLKTEDHQTLFTQLSFYFLEQNQSRSDGREALDLLVDLILMDKSFEDLKPQEKKSWLQTLRLLRNPKTTTSDGTSSSINNSWPQFVKIKKQRQGDRLVHQMEIQFLNQQDLEQKLSRLQSRGSKQ